MSRRGKKRVDYSHFGMLDEDDDDFAEFTPPASKKIKTSSSKPEGKPKDKTSSKNEKNKNSRTERKSLNRPRVDDELFENELQMALEMSMSESQEVKEESPLVDSNKENKVEAKVESLEHAKKGEDSPNVVSVDDEVKEDNKPHKPANTSDDEIEVIATDITESIKPRRTPAPKKSKQQEESDFEDDMDDVSSDDDDDDDEDYSGADSDFDDCKKKSKSKAKTKQPKKSAAPAKVKAAPVSKVKVATGKTSKPSVPKSSVKTPTLKTSSTAKPSSSVTRPSPVNRPPLTSPSPRWNPPGPAGNKKSDTSSICSPTSGLRLGLSRNMKLKPLHPNLQVQH
ncbi:RAD51-associated protein 1-like [Saccostrea cucullata]|uniref:RAD51-associated protein 1-like n=1 Tax=Saccostrea cuccullata TaxID=36930 RepID=UPI002ED45E5B